MVHSMNEITPDLTRSQVVELLEKWQATALEACRQNCSKVFVTLRRSAAPRKNVATLCDRSRITGEVMTAAFCRDRSGPHWKVTVLFDAASVASWCSARIAQLMAPHN